MKELPTPLSFLSCFFLFTFTCSRVSSLLCKTCSLKDRRKAGDFLRGNVHKPSLTTLVITEHQPPQYHLGSVLCVLIWVWQIQTLVTAP